MDSRLGGVLFYDDVYMDSILKKSKKGISIGTQVAAHTCNQQVRIVATGNMTSHGTVTAVGHISTTNRNISTTNRSISGKSLSGTAGSCTGAAQTTLPLVGGVYLCLDSIAAVGTEICLRSFAHNRLHSAYQRL